MNTLGLYYGGTFDPVHKGHLAIARAARDLLHCPVTWLPAADPPHRAAPGASAEARYRMLRLALEGEIGMDVDRRELERTGLSYTIDTLRALRDERGCSAPIAMLIGADSFLAFDQWREWVALMQLAHWVIAERPGNPIEQELPNVLRQAAHARWTRDPEDLRQTAGGRLLRLHQPWQAESATAVRNAIAKRNDAWRTWVPARVADYIRTQGLYGICDPGSGS